MSFLRKTYHGATVFIWSVEWIRNKCNNWKVSKNDEVLELLLTVWQEWFIFLTRTLLFDWLCPGRAVTFTYHSPCCINSIGAEESDSLSYSPLKSWEETLLNGLFCAAQKRTNKHPFIETLAVLLSSGTVRGRSKCRGQSGHLSGLTQSPWLPSQRDYIQKDKGMDWLGCKFFSSV